MFLLILCSYWFCVPTDPVILLILCSYWYLLYLYSYWSSVPTDPVFLLILCSSWTRVPTDTVYWCYDVSQVVILEPWAIILPLFLVESWSESQSWDAGHWWSRPCFFIRLWKWFKGAFEVHITFILTTILHYLMPMIALDGTNSSLAPK